MSSSIEQTSQAIQEAYAELIKTYQNEADFGSSSMDVNKDMEEALQLSMRSQKHESPFELEPSVASIFLQPNLFGMLTQENFNSLCCVDAYHQQKAILAFDAAPLTKEYIEHYVDNLAVTIEESGTLETQCSLLNISKPIVDSILLVPAHAKLFNWDEFKALYAKLTDLFDSESRKGLEFNAHYAPIAIAMQHAGLRTEIFDLLSNKKLPLHVHGQLLGNASKFGAEVLNEWLDECNQAIQESFYAKLSVNGFALAFVGEGQPETIFSVVQRIARYAINVQSKIARLQDAYQKSCKDEQYNEADKDAQVKEIAQQEANLKSFTATVGELLLKCATKRPELLLLLLNDEAIIQALKAEQLDFLLWGYGPKPETQQLLVEWLLENDAYLKTLPSKIVRNMAGCANLEQFQRMMADADLREKIKHYQLKDGPNGLNQYEDEAIYHVLSKAKKLAASDLDDPTKLKQAEMRQQKAHYLLSHQDMVNALLPAQLLDIAVNPEYVENINYEMLTSALQTNPPKTQFRTEVQGSLLRGLGSSKKHYFDAFMQHDVYKEAWIRDVLNDHGWDTLGQGFFCKKTPTTIAKARAYLDERNHRPLESDELQAVLDMFREAAEQSHNYLCFDLRDRLVQELYDKIALLPDAKKAEVAAEDLPACCRAQTA